MHYFTSQLPADQGAALSLRATQYRKKGRSALQQPHHEPPLDSPDSPDEHEQVPPKPFPHAPAATPRPRYGPSQIQHDMAKPPSRLYTTAISKGDVVGKQNDSGALKRKHVNLLTTLMHRCLLEGDYERAGRAWGILLQTQVTGRPVDLRNHKRWGIGAEILLRRKQNPNNEQRESLHNRPHANEDIFHDEGFELAREYYQRLIVQFASRKGRTQVEDEKDFYPAMFSLWIFEVCEKSRRSRKQAEEEAAHQFHSPMDESMDNIVDADDSRMGENEIQLEELARATEIAERLDQVIVSPPFDKEPSLLQLRGHLCLWISNLHVGQSASDDDWNMDSIMGDAENTSGFTDQPSHRIANSIRELQQAQTYFQRATAVGAPGQAATLSSIEFRIRELAQYSSR